MRAVTRLFLNINAAMKSVAYLFGGDGGYCIFTAVQHLGGLVCILRLPTFVQHDMVLGIRAGAGGRGLPANGLAGVY